MKRITYLLSLFLMVVGTATAEVIKSPSSTLLTVSGLNATEVVADNQPVTELANLSNNKAYTLCTSRSELVAKTDNSRIATTNDISGTFDASNPQYQFALLKNTSGSYYLYSISASKFVNKTGDLVETPADPILFKDGNASGTFVLYFDASHYMNMGGSNQLIIDNWSSVDEGNSYTITPVADFAPSEALLSSINTVDVTVNFFVDGKPYSSVTKSYTINTAISAETFAADLNGTYLTFANTDVQTVTNETATINVNCTVEALPFTASESYANAVWYIIDMHSNDTGAGDILRGAKNYIWTATTDAKNYTSAEVSLPMYDTKQSAAPADSMLWCFVGNVVDGFVIYNKAAGAGYALAKPETGNKATKLAAVGDATPFRIYKSTVLNGATCFKKQGDTDFVNTQKVGDVKVLRGWGDADGGSSCRFFAPDYYLLNYAASLAAGPANSLGTAKYFNGDGKFDAFNNAVAAANADHHSVEALAKLSTILTDYASNDANAETNDATITEGYYRLMNCNYKTYMTNDANNALWGNVSVSDALAKAGTIVKVVADGDNYKLLVQGLEVGQVTMSQHVGLVEDGVAFTITPTNNKFVFQNVADDNRYKCLHQAAGQKVVGWEAAAEASKWYIVPATTLDVNLNVVGDKTYATTYLPFGVTLPDDVKAYIVNQAADGVATVSEVADVPANQGVVLVGQNASVTSVALTLDAATADCTGNLLSGRNTQLTIDEAAKANYFIFGNGDNGVGFYHPNSTTLKENRAFLPADNVSAGSSASGFRLDFGGEITGIASAIQADDANATYYDLSGRRVNRPAKGLYVKDGKKIYVK